MATEHSIFSEALTSAFFDHQVFSPGTFAASYAKTFCSATLFFFGGLNKLPGDSKAGRQQRFFREFCDLKWVRTRKPRQKFCLPVMFFIPNFVDKWFGFVDISPWYALHLYPCYGNVGFKKNRSNHQQPTRLKGIGVSRLQKRGARESFCDRRFGGLEIACYSNCRFWILRYVFFECLQFDLY